MFNTVILIALAPLVASTSVFWDNPISVWPWHICLFTIHHWEVEDEDYLFL